MIVSEVLTYEAVFCRGVEIFDLTRDSFVLPTPLSYIKRTEIDRTQVKIDRTQVKLQS
jgi:hypothetical protein